MKKILVFSTNGFINDGVTRVIFNIYHKTNNNYNYTFASKTITNLTTYEKILFNRLNFLGYISFIKKIKRTKFDICHIHGNSRTVVLELIICFFAGIKTRIVHSHNSKTYHPFLHFLLFPIFILLCTKRIAVSKLSGKHMYSFFPFQVITNYVSEKPFLFSLEKRADFVNLYNLENKMIIGHVGNFLPQKNHRFIIKLAILFKSDNRFFFILVGSGPLEESIKNEVKLHNLQNVLILSDLKTTEFIINVFDLFILPSFYEGLPLVLIEATLNGLFCFVSNKISNEINVLDNISFLPLNEALWYNLINSYKKDRIESRSLPVSKLSKIKSKGYTGTLIENQIFALYE
jgi:glycosyltransferase involved in cell wall biosynthesis